MKLMLLIVLTSTSVVVAARWQRKLKILQIANKERKSEIAGFGPEVETIEIQNSKIKRLIASA